jgi:hypothetical protein
MPWPRSVAPGLHSIPFAFPKSLWGGRHRDYSYVEYPDSFKKMKGIHT